CHPGAKTGITRSPTLNRVTPSPVSTTSAHASESGTSGVCTCRRPPITCMSRILMAAASMRRRTWRGPGLASGCSIPCSRSTPNSPLIASARIASPSADVIDMGRHEDLPEQFQALDHLGTGGPQVPAKRLGGRVRLARDESVEDMKVLLQERIVLRQVHLDAEDMFRQGQDAARPLQRTEQLRIAAGFQAAHMQLIFEIVHGESEEHTSELQSRENLVC